MNRKEMNAEEMKQINGGMGMFSDLSCTNLAENNADLGQVNLAVKLNAGADLATEAKLAMECPENFSL